MNGSLVQVTEGGAKGKRLYLKNRQSVTFGSDFSCTVILRTEGFKPKQAIMSLGDDNLIWFKNLEASGQLVKVNGTPVGSPVSLKHGDQITFESCVSFVYESDPPTSPPPLMPSPFPDLLRNTGGSDLNIEDAKLQELLQPKKSEDSSFGYINEQIKRKLGSSSSGVPTGATTTTTTSEPAQEASESPKEDAGDHEDGAETDDEEKKADAAAAAERRASKAAASDHAMHIDNEEKKKTTTNLGADEEMDEEATTKDESSSSQKKNEMDVDKEEDEEEAEQVKVEAGTAGSEEVKKPGSGISIEGTGEAKVVMVPLKGKPKAAAGSAPGSKPAPNQNQNQEAEVKIRFGVSEHGALLQSVLAEGLTGQVHVAKDGAGGLTFTLHFPNVIKGGGGRRPPPIKQALRGGPQQPQRGGAAASHRPPPRAAAGRGGVVGGVGGGGGIKRKRSPPPAAARGTGAGQQLLQRRRPPIPPPPKKAGGMSRPGGGVTAPTVSSSNRAAQQHHQGLNGKKPMSTRPVRSFATTTKSTHESESLGPTPDEEAEGILSLAGIADEDTGMFLLPNGSGGLSRRSHRLAQQGPVPKRQRTDGEEGEEGEDRYGDDDQEEEEEDDEKSVDRDAVMHHNSHRAKRAPPTARIGGRPGRPAHRPPMDDDDKRGVGMTLLWAAEKVLREERKPMKSPEIIKRGREKGYIGTDSKRADNSLVGRFSTSITKDPDSPFVRVSPATYGLKEYVDLYKELGYETSES